jgi:hypothetical protein
MPAMHKLQEIGELQLGFPLPIQITYGVISHSYLHVVSNPLLSARNVPRRNTAVITQVQNLISYHKVPLVPRTTCDSSSILPQNTGVY